MDNPVRMDNSQFRRAKKLIRHLCANCDGGFCFLLDHGDPCICPQTLSYTLICKYFRAAVLPADRKVHRAIMSARPVKCCRICGKPIFSCSNSVKYCPACALRERRRRDRERKAKAAPHFRK